MCSQFNGQFIEQNNIGNRINLSVVSPPSYIDEGTRIEAVADECLLEIFSFLSQDLMDLCAVAETCKRFRSIAQRVIRKNFSFRMCYRRCTTQYRFTWGTWNYKSDKQINVKRTFRNFGISLTEVMVFIYEKEEGFVLNLVNKHCRDNLKFLSINRLSNAVPVIELKPVFRRLQTLHFQFVFIKGGATLFRKLDSLVELSVDFVTNCSTILENVFPQLETFSYYKDKVTMGTQMSHLKEQDAQSLEMLLTFIKRHSALKTLSMRFFSDQNCWTAIMQTIASNCTKLQDLRINMKSNFDPCRFTSVPFQSLRKITTIKSIRLHNVSFDGFEIFCNLVNLRELVFVDCYIPENLNQFAHLAQINRFSLIEALNSAKEEIDAVGIIKHLINLEKFVIFGSHKMFVLDEAKFVQIADLVRERPKVLTMECNTIGLTNFARNLLVTKL